MADQDIPMDTNQGVERERDSHSETEHGGANNRMDLTDIGPLTIQDLIDVGIDVGQFPEHEIQSESNGDPDNEGLEEVVRFDELAIINLIETTRAPHPGYIYGAVVPSDVEELVVCPLADGNHPSIFSAATERFLRFEGVTRAMMGDRVWDMIGVESLCNRYNGRARDMLGVCMQESWGYMFQLLNDMKNEGAMARESSLVERSPHGFDDRRGLERELNDLTDGPVLGRVALDLTAEQQSRSLNTLFRSPLSSQFGQ